MSTDYNSSQPVRTQTNGDVVVEVCDGSTPTQKMGVNAAGSAQVAGQGVAGTPAGGVVSVQGVTGGTSIPVTYASSDVFPATGSISAQDIASTSTAQANGQLVITGAPTASSFASFALASSETVEVQVTGTWTGTLSCEVSMDGGTRWFGRGVKQTDSSYLSSSFTANFEGVTNVGAITNYRVRATAAWTGTATVQIVESLNTASIVVSNPVMLRDSTTQSITNVIKAASTAALATDPSLVVAISPNSIAPVNVTQILGATPSAANALPAQLSTGGSYVSNSNPLPVTIDPLAAGTPKNYFTDSVGVGIGSTATQSTTVGGATGFYLQQIVLSGEGKFKGIVQIGGVTFWTGFNSSAFPTVVIPVPNNTLVATGTVIQVLMTNNDLGASDLYSTFSGFQV
jgi:hypothetical protein